MSKKNILLTTGFFISSLCLVGFAYQATNLKVTIAGKTATSKAREIDGVLYAPIDDIAKPFDYKISRKGSSIELIPISGVNQREGYSGTLNVWVKGGLSRLRVTGVEPDPDYDDAFYVVGEIQAPAETDYSLRAAVIVFDNQKQANHTLTAGEMGGGSYLHLNQAETGEFKIRFNKIGDAKPERIVITINSSGKTEKEEVYRIRIADEDSGN